MSQPQIVKEASDALPQRGHVSNAAQPFRIGEDFELASGLQHGEFQEHFGLNRKERRTVRKDIAVAKVVQTEEELRQQQERMRHMELRRSLEIADQEAARKFQRQLTEEAVREREEEVRQDRARAVREQERLLQEAASERQALAAQDELLARREEERLRFEDEGVDEALARRVEADLRRRAAEEIRHHAENDSNYARQLYASLRLEESEERERLTAEDKNVAQSLQRALTEQQLDLTERDQRMAALLQKREAEVARAINKAEQSGVPGDTYMAQRLQDEEIARMLQEREIRKYRRRQQQQEEEQEKPRSRVFSDGDFAVEETNARAAPALLRSQSEFGARSTPEQLHRKRVQRTRVTQRTENGRTTEETHRELELTDSQGQVHRQHHSERRHYTGPRVAPPPVPDEPFYMQPVSPPVPVAQQGIRCTPELEPPPLPARKGLPILRKDKKK